MTISFVRTIILYFITIVALRIMGKRQVGELSPSEFVVTILISELAAIPMQDSGIPLIAGIVPILTLLAIEIIMSTLTLKCNWCRRLIIGENSILINNGVINQKEMRRIRLTLDELLEELRLKDYPEIDKVRYAILETSGKLTVIPFPEFEKPTRQELKVKYQKEALPLSVISDGDITWENVKKLKKDKVWIKQTIIEHGYTKARDIFLMQVDEEDNVTIIPRELQ